MPMANGEKYERKYYAHFINDAFNAENPNYTRLGKDLEEYTIEMNPDVETKKNILGENSVKVKGYEPQSSVDPYYAYKGDALFEQLQKIVNERATGSALETTVVDLLLTSDGTVEWAYREDVSVVPKSSGGGDGVQIPFDIYYRGNRTKGDFDLTTKKFTAQTAQTT